MLHKSFRDCNPQLWLTSISGAAQSSILACCTYPYIIRLQSSTLESVKYTKHPRGMEQRQTSRPEAAAEAEGPVSTSRTRKRSAIWLRLTSQSAANCAAAVIVRQTEAGRAQAS